MIRHYVNCKNLGFFCYRCSDRLVAGVSAVIIKNVVRIIYYLKYINLKYITLNKELINNIP